MTREIIESFFKPVSAETVLGNRPYGRVPEEACGEWKVTDPKRIAAGYYGTTFHKTKREAEKRVAMFPGSVMERIGAAS